MSRAMAASKKRKTTPPLTSGGGGDGDDVISSSLSTTGNTNITAVGGVTEESNKRARGAGGGSFGSASSAPLNGAAGGDKQFYETKLTELEEEIKLIKAGEHPNLVEKVKTFEKRNKEDLQKATLLRDLRRKEVDQMYDFQIQEANDVLASRKKELQDRMLLDTEESMKRMKELRDGAAKKKSASGRGRSGSMTGVDEEESQEEDDANAGNTLGGDEGDEAGQQQILPKKSSRNAAALERRGLVVSAEPSINYAAPNDAIAQDLAAIHSDWMKRVEAFHSKDELLNLNVRVEEGKLYYNENIIEKGVPVVVHSEATTDDLYGVVSKVTATEVMIKLADGGNSRLLLSHLRSGRCKIARDVKDTMAS